MANTVTLVGFDEFNAKLKNAPKRVLDHADGIVLDAANEWEDRAVRDAPVNFGFLRRGITSRSTKFLEAEAISNSEASAWMEWGTKERARIPADIASYASQFKGKSGGGDAKKMIFAWAKKKGIEENAWWPIFLSIMRHGVYPHPYFFIQRLFVERFFVGKMQKLMSTPL